MCRTQDGNNNAYCQDNPTGWVDWSTLGEADDETALIARLSALRRRFAQLRPRRWVEGRRADGSFGVLWLTPRATEMTEQDWKFPEGRFLSYLLAPLEADQPALYIVLNAAPETIELILPDIGGYSRWTVVLSTAPAPAMGAEFSSGSKLAALPSSVSTFSGVV
jgi:glycogen operon protein